MQVLDASPATQYLLLFVVVYVGRADFIAFVRFENTHRVVENARRHSESHQLCLLSLASSRYFWHVARVLLRCAGLIALRHAVLAVDGWRLAEELGVRVV